MTRLFVGHVEGTASLSRGPVDLIPGLTQFGNSGPTWSDLVIPATASEVDGVFHVDAFSYAVNSGTDDGVEVRFTATSLSRSGSPREVFALATVVAAGQTFAVNDDGLLPGLTNLGPFFYEQIDFQNPGPDTVNVTISYTIRYSVDLYASIADPHATSFYAGASCFTNTPPANSHESDIGEKQCGGIGVGWSDELADLLVAAWSGPNIFLAGSAAPYLSSDASTWARPLFTPTGGNTAPIRYLWLHGLGLWAFSDSDGDVYLGAGSAWTRQPVGKFGGGLGAGFIAYSGSRMIASATSFGVDTRYSDDGGATWNDGGSYGAGAGGYLDEIVWAGFFARFVAVGSFFVGGSHYRAATTLDGVTWTGHALDANGEMQSLCWAPELGRLVAGAYIANGSGSQGAAFWYSNDGGATWSAGTSPWDASSAYASATVQQIAWSPSLGRFIAAGFALGTGGSGAARNPSAAVVAVSPDGITWTAVGTPMDVDPTSGLGQANGVVWSESLGKFVVAGQTADQLHAVMTSADTATWKLVSGPWDGSIGADVNFLAFDTEAACASGGTFSPPTASGAAPEPPVTSSFKP